MKNHKKMTLFILLVIAIPILYVAYIFADKAMAKRVLQKSINEEFNNQFVISRIDISRSPDLFHFQNGYEIWLKDKKGLEFTNFVTGKNDSWDEEQKGWILEAYQKAKLERK